MKRLFIDLDICNNCQECRVDCAYFYHPTNNGITNLREYATFALFCRHCEEAPCVNSCYHNALQKQPEGDLKRYNMRCTSCKSCSLACPFGTILADFIPYLDSRCDYCLRTGQQLPKCVGSCPYHAVEFKEIEENYDDSIFFIGRNLAARSKKWFKEERLRKK